jgi:hypothetical protein
MLQRDQLRRECARSSRRGGTSRPRRRCCAARQRRPFAALDGAAAGDAAEEAEQLAIKVTRGRDDRWKTGVGGTCPGGMAARAARSGAGAAARRPRASSPRPQLPPRSRALWMANKLLLLRLATCRRERWSRPRREGGLEDVGLFPDLERVRLGVEDVLVEGNQLVLAEEEVEVLERLC